jgi:ribose transport system substrate-binding protein
MRKGVLVIAGIVILGVLFVSIGIARKNKNVSKLQIAVVPKASTHIFWQSVRAGAEKAAAEAGVEMFWNAPERESDREKQVQIIEDFIVRKVAGIVFTPLDSKALVPSVEKLYEKHIPCVIIDSDIDSDKYVSFIATNNYQGGVIAARRMGQILNGKGRIIVVKYIPGSASTTNRENGFIETIQKEFGDIKIVDSKYAGDTVETALQATEDLLTRNPSINGLYAPNSSSVIGAMRAVDAHQLAGKIKIVGFDVEKPMLDGLRTGSIDSFVSQDPYGMGYQGVKTLLDRINGKDVPKHKETELKLITKENIDTPEIQAFLKNYIGTN